MTGPFPALFPHALLTKISLEGPDYERKCMYTVPRAVPGTGEALPTYSPALPSTKSLFVPNLSFFRIQKLPQGSELISPRPWKPHSVCWAQWGVFSAQPDADFLLGLMGRVLALHLLNPVSPASGPHISVPLPPSSRPLRPPSPLFSSHKFC